MLFSVIFMPVQTATATQASPHNGRKGPLRTCAQTVSSKGDAPDGFSRLTRHELRITTLTPPACTQPPDALQRRSTRSSLVVTVFSSSLATSDQPLVSRIDGYACRSIFAVNLFKSTELPKLMDTLCASIWRRNVRFETASPSCFERASRSHFESASRSRFESASRSRFKRAS